MKVKTSVSISEDLLRQIDERVSAPGRRSDFIESAVREHLHRLERQERSERDIALINQYADELNVEAEDVLRDQADAFTLSDE